MAEKKKAHSDVTTSGRAKANEYQVDTLSKQVHLNITEDAMSSVFEDEADTPSTEQHQFPVRDILSKGKENAISPREACKRLGISNERNLRAEINSERCRGALILTNSSRGGYYLPGSREEIEEFVAIMTARAETTITSLKAARQLLEEEQTDA